MVFLLIACKNGQRETEKKVFRYNIETGLNTLDPAFARDEYIIWNVSQLYNGLVQLNENLKVVPDIAKRWEIRDSGRTYIFYLRNDVYFIENKCFKNKKRKVIAHDFVYSLSRIVNPKTASTGAWIFNDKIDVEALNKSNYKPFKAVNDTTLVIQLTKPFPPFLSMLSMPYCYVVPHEAVEMYGKEFRKNPVGTGPFRLKLWEEGIKLVLERNPNYFESTIANQVPKLDAIEVSFIENKQTAFMEFMQGKLDFFDGLEGSFKDEILSKEGKLKPSYKGEFRLEVNPYLNVEYFGFLQDSNNASPWQDVRVRKAIHHAIDREKMMLFLRNNIGISANAGFVPPSLGGLSGATFRSIQQYNPKLSKKLLADAGYPNGNGLPKLEINTTKNYLDLATFIQKQLKEVGVESSIEVSPGPSLRSKVSKGNVQFFRGSWIADYPDAENYLSLFYSKNKAPNGPNYTRFENNEYDSLYETALLEVDIGKRSRLNYKMDSLVAANYIVLPLYYAQSLRLVQPWVKNLKNNAMNRLLLKDVDIIK
jgi:peptide/nickel transport system substrate-binding protein